MPPNTHERNPELTAARQAGTQFTYPGGMKGWVDLVAGYILYTQVAYVSIDSRSPTHDVLIISPTPYHYTSKPPLTLLQQIMENQWHLSEHWLSGAVLFANRQVVWVVISTGMKTSVAASLGCQRSDALWTILSSTICRWSWKHRKWITSKKSEHYTNC